MSDSDRPGGRREWWMQSGRPPVLGTAVAATALAACVAPPFAAGALVRVAADVEPYAERLLQRHEVPGALVAVLDVDPGSGREATWLRGFGRADAAGQVLSTDAVCRVGSVSKLLTAMAAMVLVGQGRLDLDADVRELVPEFEPRGRFAGVVTLRHLLSHRAGLGRESPVGSYFDASEPDLAATVASLAGLELVAAPGAVFKYSNAGYALAGLVIERAAGEPFERAVRRLVIEPLRLSDTDFAPRPDLVARQPEALMWTYDERAIATPGFRIGCAPAAELRSTVADLLALARSWLPDARRRVLPPAAQAAMWEVPGGVPAGCGLGFFVGELDGHRTVGHDGAVYGFASALRALPEDGVAVAVVCTRDFANEVAAAIAERALRAVLAARRDAALPPPLQPEPVGTALARALAGTWQAGVPQAGPQRVELDERDGELYFDPDVGVRTRLGRLPDGALVADDPLGIGGSLRLVPKPDGTLRAGELIYTRCATPPPAAAADLLPLCGEYGFDHNALVVYEHWGRLGVLLEWLVRDLPEREGADAFRFLPGMYGGDQLRFERDAEGRVVAAILSGVRLPRRLEPAAGGFRIEPLRPVVELQARAAVARPPAELPGLLPSDLVDLAGVEPTLRFDLKYATADNILGTPLYAAPAALLQRPAAEALARAHRGLQADGLGILVLDAYRPWSVTKVLWDATPDRLRQFVADPALGSRHNRGCAVDVTLFELATGEPVEMPSGFDEFTPRAAARYPGGTTRQRWHRDRLRRAMAAEGFTVDRHEWWHFDYADWARYPIGNQPLGR